MAVTVKENGRADYTFLLSVGILLAFGLLMLSSASVAVGHERFGDSYFFIKRQILYGVLPGLLAFAVMAKIPYVWLKRYAGIVYIGAFITLVLVFIPGIGSSLNSGAQSWLVIGNISLQPAEFAKIALVLFMASFLAAMGEKLQDLKEGFLPALIVGFIPVLLVVLQPDIGTVAILFATVFGMLFLAGARWLHLGGVLAAGILGLAGMIAVAPYRAARFTTFLHPELDPQGIGYHINQAYLAIGSGGWFGLGLGHSRQKFAFLPEVHADSIFAVIAEEMGFIIAMGLIILFVIIALRGFRIAKGAPDHFGRLLVGGVMVWILAQTSMNLGAMLGLMPLTGVPLPFISHGGTALIIALMGVGVVANVSRYATIE